MVLLSRPHGTSSSRYPAETTITPLVNRMDVHLGVGYEFNADGHLCRRDVINLVYKVDDYGGRITNRTTTCPPHLDSETWWETFTPKDKIKWYVDMKARGLAEIKAREAIASSDARIVTPAEIPEVSLDDFIGTDTGHGGPWFSDAEWVDMRERATAFANRAAPALFAAPKKRNNNPVHKIKQLGTAGLFSDENEVYIYDESDSGASTSGAAPASLIKSDEDGTSPWESLEEELELESMICAVAQASPQKVYDHVPAMPCVADCKGGSTVPKSSLSFPTG